MREFILDLLYWAKEISIAVVLCGAIFLALLAIFPPPEKASDELADGASIAWSYPDGSERAPVIVTPYAVPTFRIYMSIQKVERTPITLSVSRP